MTSFSISASIPSLYSLFSPFFPEDFFFFSATWFKRSPSFQRLHVAALLRSVPERWTDRRTSERMSWLNIEVASRHSSLSHPHICPTFPLYFPLLVLSFLGSCWPLEASCPPTCVTMCAVVLEMLCRAEEVGFPDMVTVMRSLSSDSGMPTLPPGGGLASKYVTSKESFHSHNIVRCSTV